MWLFKLFKSNRYEILIPPCNLDYDNWTKKQAEEYLNWFVAHVPERAAYVLKKATGKSLPEGPIPPEVLLHVWKWFLRVATTEPVPEEEQEAQRAAFGHFGEDFIDKEQLSLQTEFIIRDIAMLMSAVFTTNYPVLYWGFDSKPKRYLFINQPVLKGFLNLDYEKPFADVFPPEHMVHVQAARILLHSAHPKDLFNLFQWWRKNIPDQVDP